MNRTEFESRLRADIQSRLKVEINPSFSQRGCHIQHGYAHVEFGELSQTQRRVSRVQGRKEGEGGFRDMKEYQLPADDSWYDALVNVCVEVLSTGRTVECGKGAGLPDRNSLMPRYEACDVQLDSVVEHIEGSGDHEPWNLNPDYQRGHVWTDRQAELFAGFWLEGGNVPLIFVQRYRDGRNAPPEHADEFWKYNEVVDGQQRLRALYRWFKGEIQAETHDGQRFWFADTNEVERRLLPLVKVAFIDLPRKERLRFYLLLNRGGTIHTEDEIQKVRDLLTAEGGE